MSKDKKSFEDAVTELEAIVEKLERGELSLEESIDAFQKGIALSKYCSKKLDEVEKKICILVEDSQGEIKEQSLSDEKISL